MVVLALVLGYTFAAIGTLYSMCAREDIDAGYWPGALYACLMTYLWPVYWASRALVPVVDQLTLPPGPGEGV